MKKGALLTSIALALSPAPRFGPAQQPTFQSRTDLVRVHAAVLSGVQPALDLEVDDFRILEDGRERAISVFSRPHPEPIEVVLAVDASGSMVAWPLKESVNLLLDSMHTGSCVLLVPFREQPLQAHWGHPRDPEVRARLDVLEWSGQEAILDALLYSFAQMRDRVSIPSVVGQPESEATIGPDLRQVIRFRHALDDVAWEGPPITGDCSPRRSPWEPVAEPSRVRRAIVVVTDGADHSSRADIEDVVMMAWGAHVPVFLLAAEPRASSGGLDSMGRPSHFGTMRSLERLTEFTGGSVFRDVSRPPDFEDVWVQLQRLIGALQAHYVLGYEPEVAEGAPPLVDRRGLQVEIRKRGYRVFAQSHVVHGAGASLNAAADLARRGFAEMASKRPDDAVHSFRSAIALDEELAWAHYGLGLALAGSGDVGQAVDALTRAADLASWLPQIHERLVNVLISDSQLERAWEHVLAAGRAGADVDALFRRLNELAPRGHDLPTGAQIKTVDIQARAPGDVPGHAAVSLLVSAVAQAVWHSPDATVVGEGDPPSFVLRVELARVRRRGTTYAATGRLVLSDGGGRELASERFELVDVREPESIQAVTTRVLEALATLDERPS